MSVDFYACDHCGDTFCECGFFVSCGCGRRWCSTSCAEADGFSREIRNKWDEPTCKFCREEDFEDGILLDFLLKKTGFSRECVIELYKIENKGMIKVND